MVDLALHYGEGPVLLRDIAKRQQVSERYLERLITLLKVAGLVISTRGAHGGFTLARPPSQIKLSEVIQTVEGSLAPVKCVDDPNICSLVDLCATRDIWIEMKGAMSRILESTTLQDLAQQQIEKGKSKEIMYHI